MAWVALVAWIATALGGGVLGTQWARHGGPRQSEGIRWPRLAAHVALAVAGLALWIVFAAGGDAIFAWVALALLGAVVAIGLSLLVLWLRGESPDDDLTRLPAEASFPLPLVVGHGLLGATTVVLSLLAALGA